MKHVCLLYTVQSLYIYRWLVEDGTCSTTQLCATAVSSPSTGPDTGLIHFICLYLIAQLFYLIKMILFNFCNCCWHYFWFLFIFFLIIITSIIHNYIGIIIGQFKAYWVLLTALFDWLIDWPFDWLIDWPFDWLID